jgi:cell division transport system permease protein
MFFVKLKRVIKSGFVNFWRNGYVSLASLLVMTVTLSVIATLIFTSALLQSTLQGIKDKVDINVYFIRSASEDDILAMKTAVAAQPDVASVDYVSRDEALNTFKEKHATDPLTLQALDELDDNPLEASLNVRAADPSDYQSIVNYLNTKDAASGDAGKIIDKINYAENQSAINALSKIIASSERLGTIIAVFFIVIAILITFNTIRLAIYISREEISVMRLVGASSRYIKGPFVVAGIIYGVFAAVITLILCWPVTYWLGPETANIGTGINLFNYYGSNFLEIFGIILGSGLLLGIISSYLAVKRYLKV